MQYNTSQYNNRTQGNNTKSYRFKTSTDAHASKSKGLTEIISKSVAKSKWGAHGNLISISQGKGSVN